MSATARQGGYPFARAPPRPVFTVTANQAKKLCTVGTDRALAPRVDRVFLRAHASRDLTGEGYASVDRSVLAAAVVKELTAQLQKATPAAADMGFLADFFGSTSSSLSQRGLLRV